MKKFRHYALLLFAVITVSSCSKDDDSPVVTLDQTTLNLYVGEKKTLAVTITPPDDNLVIAWASSDETIATVEDGTVVGKSAGTVIITAAIQDGGKVTCTVTVTWKGYPWYLDGKKSGSFEIATLEELKQFELLANGDETALDFNNEFSAVDFKNKTITLKNDINLNNEEWVPIGNEKSQPFQGIFDGNGKTISGLKVSGTLQYAGFFGCTSMATVKNLKVSDGTVSAIDAAGGIVGYADENSIVENCSSSVMVTGPLAGGIVGWAFKSAIKACHATGKIAATKNNNPNSSVAAGGIVGYLAGRGSIQACYYTTETVTGGELVDSYFNNGVGGIAGQVGSSSEKVTNCYSTGKVIAGVGNKVYSGGVIGFANYSNGYSSLLYTTDKNTSRGIGEKATDNTSIVKSIASENELSANIDFLNTGLPGEVGYRFKADGTLEKVQ